MMRLVGVLLLILSLPLAGTVILSVVKDRGQKLHEILMIAMAAYAFTKITLATINLIKARKYNAPKQLILRNLSFADAFVSIFALQRSMLVSFGEMKASHILLFNILTGTAVWLIVLLLGINLIGVLKTAQWLEENGKPFWLRYVLVPGISDFEEDIRALGEHFKGYRMLQRVEILPYHTLGRHKYESLGWEYRLNDTPHNTPQQLDRALALFNEYFDCAVMN